MISKRIFSFGILMCLMFILPGCKSKQPILVGFAGELTGKRGQAGVDARDGAQLAVDLINENGGIQGRPIELLIRDDKGDPDTARQVDAELVEQKVVAIIGHNTSGQAAAVFDQINKAKVVLISPGASSSQFSGQADFFFRIVPTTDLMGELLATHIYKDRDVHQLSCIYDSRNQVYAEPLWQAIQKNFEAFGGSTGQVFMFVSGETELEALMLQVKTADPEAIVFIASGIDVALMAQYGQQQGLEARLFSSPWVQSADFLEKGGNAVEGLELIAGYTPQIPYPPSQVFAERFEARYKRLPGLHASNGYEAMMVLAHALEQTKGKAEGLPVALIAIKDLEGAYSPISIDEYGDVKRPIYIAVVKDGQFKIISTVSPAD